MHFYVADKNSLESAVKTAYRKSLVLGAQKENVVLDAGEEVWKQVISPNFGNTTALPFMWYENSGYDVIRTSLEELNMKHGNIFANPEVSERVEDGRQYSPINFLMYRYKKVGGLISSGILAPVKDKFSHSNLSNYLYNLFNSGLMEANPFWAVSNTINPSTNNHLDHFLIESINSLKLAVISTYLYMTIKLNPVKNTVVYHIPENKIPELSEIIRVHNPIFNPTGLYEAYLQFQGVSPDLIELAKMHLRDHIRHAKSEIFYFAKDHEGWQEIKYTR